MTDIFNLHIHIILVDSDCSCHHNDLLNEVDFSYFRHSVDSICSDDPDLVDLGASASSVTFPNFHVSCVYLMNQGDEVDETLKQHVSKVISESSVTNTVYTSQIFPKLYW